MYIKNGEVVNHIMDNTGNGWDGRQPLVGKMFSSTGDPISASVKFRTIESTSNNILLSAFAVEDVAGVTLKNMNLWFC